MKRFILTTCLLYLFFDYALAQLNMTLLGHLSYPDPLASVWGYTANGREYALVGEYSGLSIIDVTNPATLEEVEFVNTANSFWHEIKTWSHYAYVVNEDEGGLLIVDLDDLPNSVTSVNWTGGALDLQTGHSIWIDENGIAYINGSNVANGGVVFLDLNDDPMNPTYLGAYTDYYVHDSYVRGDTMWTSEIGEGWFRVVDVSDKTDPEVLAQQSTPGNFNHNTSLSDDGNFLFTTDEKPNSFVTAYDVSDLSDITELDRFQANPGTNSIGHNVHVKGNYIVIAYYTDGVIIADATHPHNLIKVGSYDTSPLSGEGYNGCWEAYPYLPSGNILASDIEEGLFVLGVNYIPAGYLEGTATDNTTGALLNGVTVQIGTSNLTTTSTNLSGFYATGSGTPGSRKVNFSKSGYWTRTINNVNLTNGVTTTLNTTLRNTSVAACVIPASLSASNITSSSATLKWSDEYASSFTVKLKNLDNNQTQTFTSSVNSYTATQLSQCTSYKFKVKAKCSSSGTFTAFSPWFNFLTAGDCDKNFSEQISQTNVNLYPNPFNDQVMVDLNLTEESDAIIAVYDASGREMSSKLFDQLSAGMNHLQLPLSCLTEGVYICRIQCSEGVFIERIVKSR